MEEVGRREGRLVAGVEERVVVGGVAGGINFRLEEGLEPADEGGGPAGERDQVGDVVVRVEGVGPREVFVVAVLGW